MIICAKCGHDNPQSVTFCERCDAFLEWNTATTPPRDPGPERPTAPPTPAPVSSAPPAPAPSVSSPPTAPASPASPSTPTPSPVPTPSAPPASSPAAGGASSATGDGGGARAGAASQRPRSPADRLAADLAVLLDKARSRGRNDLVDRLVRARRTLADRELPVVVAGEYKQGKSSLVNAIVKTSVCPVDDDIVTAVPTVVRYGDRAEARIHVDDRPVPTIDVLDVDDRAAADPGAVGSPGRPGPAGRSSPRPPASAPFPDPPTTGGPATGGPAPVPPQGAGSIPDPPRAGAAIPDPPSTGAEIPAPRRTGSSPPIPDAPRTGAAIPDPPQPGGPIPDPAPAGAAGPEPPTSGARPDRRPGNGAAAGADRGSIDDDPPVPLLAGDDRGVPIAFEDVGRYARGDLVPADATGRDGVLRSVEVRLARQVLQAGLTFVDSPGVGGLESAEGSIVLGVLDLAEALIFVTDASQELTRAELSFLQAAVTRCPKVVCVMTKTDLHADWRRMADLDRAHLAQAGLDVEVVPVSSFLRLRAAARNDATMNAESGFPVLFDLLRDRVVAEGRAGRLAQVAEEIAFVAGALERAAAAESAVIARPEQAPQVMQQLAQATQASAALQSSQAPWQQVLTDGIQDLVANVDHELRNRLKAVVRSGEDIIARADPADSWSEFEVWLRRQVVTAAVETYRYLTDQAAELTERVGRQFDDDAGGPIALSISAPVAKLEQVRLGGEFGDRKGIRSALALSAARGSYGGMVMFGMAGTLIGYSVAAPVMMVLSLGLGRRALREERRRHHQQNQAQARAALQRYAGEVGLLVDKECKDALRRTQRLLRDEFTARARSMHQSDRDALALAEQARRLPPTARAARQEAAAREVDELGALAGVAVAAAGPAGAHTSGGAR